jgi:hypothetical protein
VRDNNECPPSLLPLAACMKETGALATGALIEGRDKGGAGVIVLI